MRVNIDDFFQLLNNARGRPCKLFENSVTLH